jgi:hypothetical protein
VTLNPAVRKFLGNFLSSDAVANFICHALSEENQCDSVEEEPAGRDGDDHSAENPAGRLAFLQKKVGRGKPPLLHGDVGEHVPGDLYHLKYIFNKKIIHTKYGHS